MANEPLNDTWLNTNKYILNLSQYEEWSVIAPMWERTYEHWHEPPNDVSLIKTDFAMHTRI